MIIVVTFHCLRLSCYSVRFKNLKVVIPKLFGHKRLNNPRGCEVGNESITWKYRLSFDGLSLTNNGLFT